MAYSPEAQRAFNRYEKRAAMLRAMAQGSTIEIQGPFLYVLITLPGGKEIRIPLSQDIKDQIVSWVEVKEVEDFPENPAEGQIHNGFIFHGAWDNGSGYVEGPGWYPHPDPNQRACQCGSGQS